MDQAGRDYWNSIARMLLVVMLWSTSGLFVRLIDGASPLQVNAGRCLVATVVLAAILFWRYGRGWLTACRAIPFQAYLLVTGFYAVGTPIFVFALANTTVAKVSAISATSPIFAAVFARVLTKDRAGPGIWMAAVLAIVGVIVMLGEDLLHSGTLNLGDLAALGVAITFSGELVALRRWHHLEMLPTAVVSNIVAVVIGLAFAGSLAVSAHDLGIMALMGTVGLAIPFFFIMQGLRHVPAIQLVLISLLDILVSPTWVLLAVGEVPSPATFLGGAAIVAGVVLATVSGAREARAARQSVACGSS